MMSSYNLDYPYEWYLLLFDVEDSNQSFRPTVWRLSCTQGSRRYQGGYKGFGR